MRLCYVSAALFASLFFTETNKTDASMTLLSTPNNFPLNIYMFVNEQRTSL